MSLDSRASSLAVPAAMIAAPRTRGGSTVSSAYPGAGAALGGTMPPA
jgi:hypothetical protein